MLATITKSRYTRLAVSSNQFGGLLHGSALFSKLLTLRRSELAQTDLFCLRKL